MNTEATERAPQMDTPGLTSALQVSSGTGVIEVRPVDVSTMSLPGPVFQFQPPKLILPEDSEATHHLSIEELGYRKGLISLLSFKLEPDQPKDEDLSPHLEYNFPE